MNYYEQIQDQPRRLRALAQTLARGDHALRTADCTRLLGARRLILTGMGSSLYVCYPAYLHLVRSGLDAALWETAELLHFGVGAVGDGTLVVAVSQSGETAEALALLDRLPPGQPLLAVTNVPGSTLGRRAGVVLDMGAEASTHASTQTYVNSLALLVAVAHSACKQPLDSLTGSLLQAADALEHLLAESFGPSGPEPNPQGSVVFLSRGPSLAAAWQAALTFQEVTGHPATAMSAAAFRHGPLEVAGPGLTAVILEPHGPTSPLLQKMAADLERFGARVIRVADSRLSAGEFRHLPVEEELAPLVNIAPAQALAYRTALALGREPGILQKAESVTRTE